MPIMLARVYDGKWQTQGTVLTKFTLHGLIYFELLVQPLVAFTGQDELRGT